MRAEFCKSDFYAKVTKEWDPMSSQTTENAALVEEVADTAASSTAVTCSKTGPQTIECALEQIRTLFVSELSREAMKKFNLLQGLDPMTQARLASFTDVKKKQAELIKRFFNTV